MKKIVTILPSLIAYFFILLFCYASISKILDFENFQVQIAQSPLLSAYAGLTSYNVIIVELVIVIFLIIPRLRLAGLYASLGIMTAFTVYIYLILNYSDFVPCSCGGILEKMGWTEHLLFNIACVILSVVSIIILEKERKRHILKLSSVIILVILFNILLVIFLFYSSEHIIKEQNNFVRRFPHHPIIEEKASDLKYNSYYLAGSSKNKLFLGNNTSPFLVLSIDKNLSQIDTIRLVPDKPHFYKAVKTLVTENYIFMYDGTVPAIYRSKLNDFSGKVYEISYQDVYFDQLAVITPDFFTFRTKSNKTGSMVLGNLDISKSPKVNLNTKILEKQVDGTFDVDGKLLYDQSTERQFYIYNYRNQIVSSDKNFQNIILQKTIDTVSHAKIQVTQLSDGSKKMLAPPLTINRNSNVYGGLLFIQSSMMGRYESRDLWRKNDIIDVYKTDPSEYWGSFYVQHRGDKKLSQMLVTDQYLFVLSGREIVRYRIAQTLADQFKGVSRKPDSE